MNTDRSSALQAINSGSTATATRKPSRLRQPTPCLRCGQVCDPNLLPRKGPLPKYCSVECKQLHNTVTKICGACGKDFSFFRYSIVDETKYPRRFCNVS